jgi:hypothetical protein
VTYGKSKSLLMKTSKTQNPQKLFSKTSQTNPFGTKGKVVGKGRLSFT